MFNAGWRPQPILTKGNAGFVSPADHRFPVLIKGLIIHMGMGIENIAKSPFGPLFNPGAAGHIIRQGDHFQAVALRGGQSIPWDSTPCSLAGFRLATTTIFCRPSLPAYSAGPRRPPAGGASPMAI